MTSVFADTGYFIGLLVESDHLHDVAAAVTKRVLARRIITSEMVLTEVLNYFAEWGRNYRAAAVSLITDLTTQQAVHIVPQTSELFAAALSLYSQRPDKSWSLTDCASMVICGREGITDVLTHDHHFQQAGFVALLRDSA